MVGIDSYMNSYLDRRMKHIIEEWDLSTRQDSRDFERRLENLEDASHEIQDFESGAEAKLDNLEARLKKLKEAKK
jgi:hypothetical protein